MLYREIMAVCYEIKTKHINSWWWSVYNFWCFFPLVHKVNTALFRAKLCQQMADNLPEELSGTGEGHTVSMFR